MEAVLHQAFSGYFRSLATVNLNRTCGIVSERNALPARKQHPPSKTSLTRYGNALGTGVLSCAGCPETDPGWSLIGGTVTKPVGTGNTGN